MPAPRNTFKAALADGRTVIGCWLGMAEGYAAEIMGKAGFDWLVIDGEHSPNDLRSIRDQLIALAASPSQPVVRVPIGETWMPTWPSSRKRARRSGSCKYAPTAPFHEKRCTGP